MKPANASKLDRKSGVRFGERGAPVDSFRRGYDTDSHYGYRRLKAMYMLPVGPFTNWLPPLAITTYCHPSTM
jgi:hypothetical protein